MVNRMGRARLKSLISVLLFLTFQCACDSLPSDQALITRFSQKRPELDVSGR